VWVDDKSAPQTAVLDWDPYSFLESSDEEAEEDAGVLQIRVKDSGSVTQFIKLSLQGVSVYEIIGSDADINIIGGQLFKHVALPAQLREKDLWVELMTKNHSPLMAE